MKRLAWLPLLVVLLAAPANAARHDSLPLHQGSAGPRVAALQWMLSGHKPSRYLPPTVGPTFHARPNGLYGKRTRQAVYDMKYRLGYWGKGLNGRAGLEFFRVLTGKQRRPPSFIARASARVNVVSTARTDCTARLIRHAVAELGVHEVPWGSNRGPRVHDYQTATTAYGAAWCESFVQWNLKVIGYGTIANRSAGVFYVNQYAYQHGWLHAIPKPGAIVDYLDGQGHTGIVQTVTAHGFYAIEGNAHDAVRRVYRPIGSQRMAFIYLPGCS